MQFKSIEEFRKKKEERKKEVDNQGLGFYFENLKWYKSSHRIDFITACNIRDISVSGFFRINPLDILKNVIYDNGYFLNVARMVGITDNLFVRLESISFPAECLHSNESLHEYLNRECKIFNEDLVDYLINALVKPNPWTVEFLSTPGIKLDEAQPVKSNLRFVDFGISEEALEKRYNTPELPVPKKGIRSRPIESKWNGNTWTNLQPPEMDESVLRKYIKEITTTPATDGLYFLDNDLP